MKTCRQLGPCWTQSSSNTRAKRENSWFIFLCSDLDVHEVSDESSVEEHHAGPDLQINLQYSLFKSNYQNWKKRIFYRLYTRRYMHTVRGRERQTETYKRQRQRQRKERRIERQWHGQRKETTEKKVIFWHSYKIFTNLAEVRLERGWVKLALLNLLLQITRFRPGKLPLNVLQLRSNISKLSEVQFKIK